MVRDAAPAGIGRLTGRLSTIGDAPPPEALSNPLREKIIRTPTPCLKRAAVTTAPFGPICAPMTHDNNGKVTALIMAGKRSGVLDPLAERAGVAHNEARRVTNLDDAGAGPDDCSAEGPAIAAHLGWSVSPH